MGLGRVWITLGVLWISCAYGAIVRTGLGELDGSEYLTKSGKHVYTFLGVPYGKPPVGPRRFQEPEQVEEWQGVKLSKEYGPKCAQYGTLDGVPEYAGEEDCLHLNVYTPSLSNSSKLPVVVYFHGGGFMFGGSKSVGPDLLFDKIDLVFVSVNYRLGPFGFLSTEDDVVPGNSGLKDQVLSLKWVKENIAYFGGDPDKVTITGNSAGGASVHYHFLSPLSRGLFHKGISSSGCALNAWAFTEEPLQKAKRLASSLGCPTDSSVIMVECLSRIPTREILSRIDPLFMPWRQNPFTPFGPVVEKSFKNPFLNEYPLYLLQTGKIFDGPWLASVTTEEGLFPAASFIDREEWMQSLNDKWLKIAPHLLDFNYTSPQDKHDQISDKVRKFYFNSKDILEGSRGILVEMLGDRLFKADMDLAAREQASVSSSPVFFYTFAYRGNVSLSDIMSERKENYGVSHFDDMYYVLSLPETEKLSASDIQMVQTMTEIWASFILTGEPSPPGGVRWEPVRKGFEKQGSLNYLLIKSPREMTMTDDDNFGHRRFWKSLELYENVNFSDLLMVEKYLMQKAP